MSFTRYFRHLLYRSPPVDCFCSKKKYFANKIVNSLLKEEKHAGKKDPTTQTEKRLKDYLHQVFLSFYFSKVSLFLFPLPPMMHFKHVFWETTCNLIEDLFTTENYFWTLSNLTFILINVRIFMEMMETNSRLTE